jgi:hypothetical protein
MRQHIWKILAILTSVGLMLSEAAQIRAADPEIDRLVQSPVGKDWLTNGGNLTGKAKGLHFMIVFAPGEAGLRARGSFDRIHPHVLHR